jgi:uncharacterized Zn finger protein
VKNMSRYYRHSYRSSYFQPRKKIDITAFKKGRTDLDPVVIDGRTIASTFWGKRWCSHFENMADFDNRLPRGRTYVRQGTVVHLEITPGHILANVAGSDLYTVNMEVAPLPLDRWENIKRRCQGSVTTIVDLLMGRFSPEVMDVVCDPTDGLFPTESEIKYDCSCPDWASLCKHVAATFYGIGNRLDRSPELLFLLRQVDPHELLASGAAAFLDDEPLSKEDDLVGDLGAIFGIELVGQAPPSLNENTEVSKSTSVKTKTAVLTKPKETTDAELVEAVRLIGKSKEAKTANIAKPENITKPKSKTLKPWEMENDRILERKLDPLAAIIASQTNLGNHNAAPSLNAIGETKRKDNAAANLGQKKTPPKSPAPTTPTGKPTRLRPGERGKSALDAIHALAGVVLQEFDRQIESRGLAKPGSTISQSREEKGKAAVKYLLSSKAKTETLSLPSADKPKAATISRQSADKPKATTISRQSADKPKAATISRQSAVKPSSDRSFPSPPESPPVNQGAKVANSSIYGHDLVRQLISQATSSSASNEKKPRIVHKRPTITITIKHTS